VTAVQPGQNQFCPFKERQFLEAIRTGSIATLQDELKRSINAAYVNVGQANHLMTAMANTDNPNVVGDLYQRAVGKIMESRPAITKAKNDLAVFLGNGN